MGERLRMMDFEGCGTVMAHIEVRLEHLPGEAKGNKQNRSLDIESSSQYSLDMNIGRPLFAQA
jgi:hypothetical protein